MEVRYNTGLCVLLYMPLLETTNEIIIKKKKKTPYILDNPFYRITLTFEAWLPLPPSCHRLERVQGVSRGRGGGEGRGGGWWAMKMKILGSSQPYPHMYDILWGQVCS